MNNLDHSLGMFIILKKFTRNLSVCKPYLDKFIPSEHYVTTLNTHDYQYRIMYSNSTMKSSVLESIANGRYIQHLLVSSAPKQVKDKSRITSQGLNGYNIYKYTGSPYLTHQPDSIQRSPIVPIDPISTEQYNELISGDTSGLEFQLQMMYTDDVVRSVGLHELIAHANDNLIDSMVPSMFSYALWNEIDYDIIAEKLDYDYKRFMEVHDEFTKRN